MAEENNQEFSWDKVDWLNKQDIQIAEETKRSRERVRQVRKERDYPECVNKGKNRNRTAFEQQLKEIGVKEHTVAELAELTEKSTDYVNRVLRSMNLSAKTKDSSHDWSSVDWGKGNQQIAAEAGTTSNYVSRLRQKYSPKGREGVRDEIEGVH